LTVFGVKGYDGVPRRASFLHDFSNYMKLEKQIKSHGGKRLGAGRHKGIKKMPTKVVRLPIDIANWIVKPSSIFLIRKLIAS
jgi:hypothetical protein